MLTYFILMCKTRVNDDAPYLTSLKLKPQDKICNLCVEIIIIVAVVIIIVIIIIIIIHFLST